MTVEIGKVHSQKDAGSGDGIHPIGEEEVPAALRAHLQAAQALIPIVLQAQAEGNPIRGGVAGDTERGITVDTISNTANGKEKED